MIKFAPLMNRMAVWPAKGAQRCQKVYVRTVPSQKERNPLPGIGRLAFFSPASPVPPSSSGQIGKTWSKSIDFGGSFDEMTERTAGKKLFRLASLVPSSVLTPKLDPEGERERRREGPSTGARDHRKHKTAPQMLACN